MYTINEVYLDCTLIEGFIINNNNNMHGLSLLYTMSHDQGF